MAILNRRSIFRLTCCLPTIWFILAVIFLQFETSARDSLDDTPIVSNDKPTKKYVEFNINPIKLVKRIINLQTNNEQIHVVQDDRDQVIAPIIDDDKIDLNGLGEMGKPVEINKTSLVPSELEKYEDGFEKNAFNAYASDLISKHRSLPDVRDSGCRQIEYKAPKITASVVMCFHNEAWSVLLRSVHSIIDRSPRHLLQEIILVDDFSDMG
jgi:fumarate reductase subunit C